MFDALFNLIQGSWRYGVTQFYLINGQKVNQHVIHLLFLIVSVSCGHIMYQMINTELWEKVRNSEILWYRGTSYRKSLELTFSEYLQSWTPDMSSYDSDAYVFLVVGVEKIGIYLGTRIRYPTGLWVTYP